MNVPAFSRLQAHNCIALNRFLYDNLDKWRRARKPKEGSSAKCLNPDNVYVDDCAGASSLIFREGWARRCILGPRNRYKAVIARTPGAIVAQTLDGTVYIAHRGTKTTKEWDVDTNITGTALEVDGQEVGKVHFGFRRSYLSVESALKTQLSTLTGKTGIEPSSVIITGHSLGAGISTLNTRAFLPEDWGLPVDIPFGALTFASPMPGFESFRDQFPHADARLKHVINEHDLIPKLPGVLGYCHVGTIKNIPEDFGRAGDNHALKNYAGWIDRWF